MEHKIRQAFDSVHASEQIKGHTKEFIAKQQPTAMKKPQKPAFARLAAACIMLLLTLTGITTLYFVPVHAIHIDTDPTSAELQVNCFNRVISVNGTEGQNDVCHMNYEQALSNILATNTIEQTVITVVGNEKMLTTVKDNIGNNANVHCHRMSKHHAKQAQTNGMSAAKYEIYLQLLQNGATLTPEEAQQMPMQQLRALLGDADCDTATAQPQTDNTDTTDYTTESDCSTNLQHNGNAHNANGHHGNGNHKN